MGAGLYTDKQAKQMEGRILSGNYIRPFTIELGMKYTFKKSIMSFQTN